MRPAVRSRTLRVASCFVPAAALLLAACGGGDAVAGPGGGDHNTPPPAGTVPAALVGQWSFVNSGGTNYYDPATGSWSGPSGVGNAWTFTADGHFTHATLLQETLYGCTTRYFWWDEGTVSADGARLTFHSARSTLSGTYTCNQGADFERPANGTTGTFAYTLAPEDGAPTLTVQWASETMSFRQHP